MSCNGHQAHVDADGKVRLVVAHTDPGVPNWLDTEGQPIGMAVYRYVGARTKPVPDRHASCRSPTSARALPDGHPVVDRGRAPAAARRPLPRRAAALELRQRVPWTPPPPPGVARPRLNAHGAAVGGAEHLVSLDPDELLADGAARAPGSTTSAATPGARTSTCWSRRSRPRRTSRSPAGSSPAPSCCARCASACCSRRAWAADPTILDEPIVAPVFVVGTGRSGTSILHELLALDPANRAPLTWELLHPGEALGADAERGPARRPRRARVLGRPATRVRVDAPQRRRRAERVHLRHDARVPLRPVGRHLRGADLLGVPRRAPTTPRRTATTARCCRRCSAASRGDAVGAQGAEPPRPAAHAVRGLPRRARRPDPPRPAEDRAVDDQPDGHDQVDAVRRRSTSTRSRRWISIGLRR